MEENTRIVTRLEHMIRGRVKNRPSKICKTPYVADVEIIDENDQVIQEVVAHAPSLGCCGYVDAGEYVYMTVHPSPKTCSHVIHLAERHEKGNSYLIGVHPKMAEKIVNNCLKSDYIDSLKNLVDLKSEQSFLNSRFDYCGIDENQRRFILEVKNVPCGDYEDIFQKDRKNRDYTSWAFDSKIAYFPDGYRKKNTDTVSPRALKHINELSQLKSENPELRTIIMFVVQRTDCLYFQASNIDPIYKDALNTAYGNGVEIIPIQIRWEMDGNCYFDKIMKYKP